MSRPRSSAVLPVLGEFRPGLSLSASGGAGGWERAGLSLLAPKFGAALVLAFVAALLFAEALAETGEDRVSALDAIVKWTPLMLLGPKGEFGGFALNIIVSFLAMGMGTVMGAFVGLGQISPLSALRRLCWGLTQLFRNSPWLVLLFYFMLLLPYQMRIGGAVTEIPGWTKASFALALPIMANISEIVRGAVNSIPSGQWEAAESLAFPRAKTLRKIILPQCVKRMTPPWMNWYAILTMATPLISILGVNDGMTLTQNALAAEGRGELLIPMYLWLMLWFFAYCYPIAVWTRRLERKFAAVS